MEIKIEKDIVIIHSDNIMIADVNSAVDFLVSIHYDTKCDKMIINKEAITEDFYILSNQMAGEILQKCINYHIKIAIYGDFSTYTSKPLQDFIYESNSGKDVFFVATEKEAIEKLTNTKQ